ncbi:hypothetical protein KIN34_01675 [Cellulomonas sp. DKR-3]|uniref:HTH luxR-type domain-containing protein n=1 Tax=Cellulomonas fulva TaxID=2835530 RepID=A0ABS5TV10_9CELL|nr:LuxR family transcriptional regulator [Cellulomonas fulva]MBT0993000.1 hypothetical protein [Cellulomonas fulva]
MGRTSLHTGREALVVPVPHRPSRTGVHDERATRPATVTASRQWVTPQSRRDAVELLRESLRGGRSVLVVGEAGVGKTALAARALEGLTVEGRAPVVVALTGAAARAGLPLSGLEPLLGDELLAIGSFARTVRALGESLAELAGDAPLVLRLDDAHLLDDASAQALGWVVRQNAVRLVATTRPAGAAGSPWLELWKDDVVERIDVEPFTVAEMEQWLAGELGGTPTSDTVRRVWAETRGNVFHARELVRAERASGALRAYEDVWVWTGRATPGSRLMEIVENDVARLSPEAQRALEVVALLCPAPLSLLLDVAPRSAVDELAHTGVATLRPQASATGGSEVVVDLAHALYAEAVRARVPGGRRREVLDLVSGSTHSSSGASLVRSVLLAMDSGLQVGRERMEAAVAEAFTQQQSDVVVRLADLALTTAPVGSEYWARLTCWRAEAWWSQSEFVRAAQDASSVVDTLRSSTVIDADRALRLVDAVQVLAATLHVSGAGIDEALAVVEDTSAWLASVDAPGTWRDELRATRLTRLGWAGHGAEHRAESLAVLTATRVPATAVRLVAPTALALADAGRFADARALCARHLPLARAHAERYRWGVGEIVFVDVLTRLWSGDLAVLADEGLRSVGQEPVPLDWVAEQAARGVAGILVGAWSQAAVDLRAANARLRVNDRGGMAAYTTAAEALAVAATGSANAARLLLDAIRAMPLRAAAALEPEVRLLSLDALAWLRDPAVAAEAAELARWAHERGAARVELEALHRLVRAGTSTADVRARVLELAHAVEGERAVALVGHVAALAAGDADLARIAERELNRCGLWLPPVEPPVALTPREREIAALAAGGMTSRAIAARLTLSVRTVDSHLARVFAKSGVHSREGLAAVLR